MKYATTEFSVAPGEEVRLVFENTADSPAMIHNVVLLTTCDDVVVQEVGQAGASAGTSVDYVPDHDAVFAATDVAKPGETVEVTFTAPEETGSYTYACTYPGSMVSWSFSINAPMGPQGHPWVGDRPKKK